MKQVLWLSSQDLSPAQVCAIKALDGEDVEIIHDPEPFQTIEDLRITILNFYGINPGGWVYIAAPSYICLILAEGGCKFRQFENYIKNKQGWQLGVSRVWETRRWEPGREYGDKEGEYIHYTYFPATRIIWENPDPMADMGDNLIPVKRD